MQKPFLVNNSAELEFATYPSLVIAQSKTI